MSEDMKVIQDMKILQQVISEALKHNGGVSINIVTIQQLHVNFDGNHQTALLPEKTKRQLAAEKMWEKRKQISEGEKK